MGSGAAERQPAPPRTIATRELMPVLCAEEDAALGDVAGGEEGDENSGEE